MGYREAAEEALVDAYVRVWRSASSYDATKGRVYGWLATIARNRAIDLLRSRSQHETKHLAEFDAWEQLSSRGPCPRQRSEDRESARKVESAMRHLPSEQREAIEMAFLNGLSHSQVAEQLDTPLGTVKSRIRAGIHAIRRHIGIPAQSVA